MAGEGAVVVVGGTHGLGRAVAELYAARDQEVIVTGRDAERAEAAAREIGGKTRGLALDLSRPQQIAEKLKDVDQVHDIVLVAIERDYNTVVAYDVERAIRLVTIKLVGYTEVVHALESRLAADGSVVLFGGLAKERPYPGSTTVSTVNDAMVGLTKALARELAPRRVNSIHPAIVGNHPAWSDKPEVLAQLIERTPLGRLVTIDECAAATAFLIDHPSVNGISLNVDGGWLIT
jgi:NAD(P)-dependent dehydrogenase (short-subunit alcohol dehydrogenase family)